MANRSQPIVNLTRCIKSTQTSYYSKIKDSVEDNIMKLSEELYSRHVISKPVRDSMQYSKVMNEYWAGLDWKKTAGEVESHCQVFLECLVATGPLGQDAAREMGWAWHREVMEKLGLPFLTDYAIQTDSSDTTAPITGPTAAVAKPARISLQEAIKTNTSMMIELISNPNKLNVDLWSADFLNDQTKDDIMTTPTDNCQKAIKLLHQVYLYFKDNNNLTKMEEFCDIMRKSCNPSIDKVIDSILLSTK